ncbi:hypothetical protein K0M31_011538, partial [Melipona bicolor]
MISRSRNPKLKTHVLQISRENRRVKGKEGEKNRENSGEKSENEETGTMNRYIPSGKANCTERRSHDDATSAVAARIVTSFRHAPSSIVVADRASFFVVGPCTGRNVTNEHVQHAIETSVDLWRSTAVAIGSRNMATQLVKIDRAFATSRSLRDDDFLTLLRRVYSIL